MMIYALFTGCYMLFYDDICSFYINRCQFPKFMDSLANQDTVPHIPADQIAMSGKNFEDLTDDDLRNMYIPGSYRHIFWA